MNKFPNKPKKIDLITTSFNKIIARLMGKNAEVIKPPKKTSTFMFWCIILFVIIFLWASTGIYILGEGLYGIVLNRGQFSSVEKGFKIGLVLPYPLSKIILVDSEPTYLEYLGEEGVSHNMYTVKLSELSTVVVVANFSYQIIDAKKFYLEYIYSNQNNFNLKNQNKLHAEIKTSIKNILNQNFFSGDNKDYCFKNLTIISNNLKNQVNQRLDEYGVNVVKLNIISLFTPNQECTKYNKNKDSAKISKYNASLSDGFNILRNLGERKLSRDNARNTNRERE